MYRTSLFFLLLLLGTNILAQEDWKLKSDKDNIKTYSKKLSDSKINAVKIESSFPCTVSQFISVLMDVGSYDDWVYNSKSSRLIKQVSPAEMYYYSEVNFPWPTTNRDFVSHVLITQDPRTKVVKVDAKNVSGIVPAKPNIVRIEKSSGEWIITPVGKNEIKIEYVLQVDPGGDLPAWLINPFASKGLVETFKNLRKQLQKPQYTAARLPFITD